jgi:hypothetical protein
MPTTQRDTAQSWLLSAVDRAFDLAEQTLAAQRQFALTLAGAAARQAEIAADTVAETIDAPVEAVATTVQASEDAAPKLDRKFDGRTYEERTVEELRERAGALEIEGRSSMSKDELINALRGHRASRSARNDTPKSQAPKQDDTPDRRPYEDRSVEELRERASELEIEGRSSMSKDELIAALRKASR